VRRLVAQIQGLHLLMPGFLQRASDHFFHMMPSELQVFASRVCMAVVPTLAPVPAIAGYTGRSIAHPEYGVIVDQGVSAGETTTQIDGANSFKENASIAATSCIAQNAAMR
jgi:hypothetical protein